MPYINSVWGRGERNLWCVCVCVDRANVGRFLGLFMPRVDRVRKMQTDMFRKEVCPPCTDIIIYLG